MTKKETHFKSSLGFVFAAAGSAVGVGNIWRFPYLAAADGGGLFIILYLVLVATFGFTLLTTDVAIGRYTKENALYAFLKLDKRFRFLGWITFVVPLLIMTYYGVIGGWVTKYMVSYLFDQGKVLANENFFANFISSKASPIVFTTCFMAMTSLIVLCGIQKGIERISKIIMPLLLILMIAITIYSLTLSYQGEDLVTRNGLEGLKFYLTPSVRGLTFSSFFKILLDAMSQIFFSLSVSMGIMITYGSYVKKDNHLEKSLAQIEICDTLVALLAGAMIIPAVYVFQGPEGMCSGPSLMFISLPKVFSSMGKSGRIVGTLFFLMVTFAALTSCISIMETLVANFMEILGTSRKNTCLALFFIFTGASILICLGYNILYFSVTLPNQTTGQLLDVVDYISNSVLMPLISLMTCILIGHILTPSVIVMEMEASGHTFRKKKLYCFMVRYITPLFMFLLFLTSTGLL